MRSKVTTNNSIEKINCSESKKILFVAMHHSVHTARWISQLQGRGWELYLFAVNDGEPHEKLKGITLYEVKNGRNWKTREGVRVINLYPFKNGKIIDKLAKKIFPAIKSRAYWLARVIKKIKPDVIHSMEMQHSGYLTLKAKDFYKGKFPTWIYSCWGSDIYYFQRLEDHRQRISEVLTSCDYLFTDCLRDVDLARKYGFKGKLLGVYPGVGGFQINDMLGLSSGLKPSERRVIVIKGYTGWVYRPFAIMEALKLCAKELKGYRVVIYLPGSKELINIAQEACNKIGVPLDIVSYSPHSEIVKLFGTARISLASSISDGTPNSMLESMIMGALPIQSDTVSTAEWINSSVNGFLVQPEDVEGFAKALKSGLTDDNLVDNAAAYNYEMLKRRIDYPVVQPKVIEAYNRAING